MKHNCKIGSVSAKDNSLNFQIKTIEVTKINKLGRTLVSVNKFFKRLVNLPDRTKIVRLSTYNSDFGGKKLEKNIIVEYKYYNGKQILRTKTDINLRCLLPL